MTTILAVGSSEGSRRCDDKCHNAQHPHCGCVCGGRYHGAGVKAVEFLRQDILNGKLGEDLKKAVASIQEDLFRGEK